jgi:hypothetical protein
MRGVCFIGASSGCLIDGSNSYQLSTSTQERSTVLLPESAEPTVIFLARDLLHFTGVQPNAITSGALVDLDFLEAPGL